MSNHIRERSLLQKERCHRPKLAPKCHVCDIEIPEEMRRYSKGFLIRLCKKCSNRTNRKNYSKLLDLDKKARHLQSAYSMFGHGKAEGYTTQRFREILQKGVICPYCNLNVEAKNVSLDHINPLSRGGDSSVENLHLTCWECNRVKGNLNDLEFKRLLTFIKENQDIGAVLITRLKAAGFMYGRK